jgi:hypothetical protein
MNSLPTNGSATEEPKLFAVYLGGRAPKCNTELHDVVFVVGPSIEETYERLLALWFGSSEGLHIDSWMELAVIDGHRVSLSQELPAVHREAAATDSTTAATDPSKKLFFVNLGAYADGQFTELHANAMVVATSEREVKSRAKLELLRGTVAVHTDDLFDIDDCLEVTSVDGYRIVLQPTQDKPALVINNGYHIIPRPIIDLFIQKQNGRS